MKEFVRYKLKTSQEEELEENNLIKSDQNQQNSSSFSHLVRFFEKIADDNNNQDKDDANIVPEALSQDKDKNKLPKKNIKKDLFPIAILSSLKISVKVILPVHFDKDFISSLVLYEE